MTVALRRPRWSRRAALVCALLAGPLAAVAPSHPAGAAANGVTDYPLPTPNGGQTDLVYDPADGAFWFTEYNGNQIGRIDATTQAVTEFAIPTTSAGAQSIALGADGNLWFTEFDKAQVGRITPAGVITEFAVGNNPFVIAAGPDGNLWFPEYGSATIGRLTTAGDYTQFSAGECPGNPGAPIGQPSAITAGPDGNLWFTGVGCNGVVGRITTAGEVTLVVNFPRATESYGITTGPDGNLWATGDKNRIIRITPTGEMTEFPIPSAPPNYPVGISAGPDGNLWFTEYEGNQVGRVTTAGYVSEFDVPTSGAGPYSIVPGPDGRMWFVNYVASIVSAIDTSAEPAPGLPVVRVLTPAEGPSAGGNDVVITGQGFTGATAVAFGDTPATSFTVDSDTQITAEVPALDQNTYDVTVITPVGTSRVIPEDEYTVLGGPPAITLVSPAIGSPLGGTSVLIQGTGLDNVTTVTFGATPALDFTIRSPFSIIATAPAGPSGTVVDVTVASGAGTSPTGPQTTFTYRFDPKPAQADPDWAPSAGGAGIVVRGTDLLGASGVLFGDQRVACPGQCNVISDTEIQVLTPPHAIGAVRVRVDSPDGPSATSLNFVFTGVGGFTPAAFCAPSCARDGAVLLASGDVLGVDGEAANLYSPATDTWRAGARCTGCAGRQEETGNGNASALVALPAGPAALCGSNCGKALSIGPGGAVLYDPATDSWSPAGGTPPAIELGPTATLLKTGKVLVVSGAKATLFDPLTTAFGATGDLHSVHNNHAATLLADGRVLVTGGGGNPPYGPDPFTALAEVYDPATGQWTDTAPMSQSRISHTSTLMADGRVLVTGGQVGFNAPIVNAEVWNPASGTWSPTADLSFARSDHDVTLLGDGRLVAAGGDQPAADFFGRLIGHNPTIAEVFDPDEQEWLPSNPSTLSIAQADKGADISQEHNVYDVLLPAGPVSRCGTRCGQVLVIRGADHLTVPPLAPSAVLFAAPPRADAPVPTAGPTDGGTAVTITGSALASVSSVTFGTTPAASVTPDPTTPDTKLVAVTPAGLAGTVDVRVTTRGGSVVAGRFTYQGPAPTPTTVPPPPLVNLPSVQGYALAAGDGGVFNFGSIPFVGSTGGLRLNQPVVALEHTPSGRGYWLASADGGVFAFGDARFLGSTGGIRLAKPVVGIKATPSGNGYWLVGADGGVFAFGDAVFRGSTGTLRLNSPIVAMERSSAGNGYWLVGADGGVFAFGDAVFRGSTGAIRLAQPIVSVARSAGGAGYWLVGADGGVFAFGDAVFRGSTGALTLNSPIVGIAPGKTGYWLCAKDGGVFAFGGVPFLGSMGSVRLNQPVVACATPRSLLTV